MTWYKMNQKVYLKWRHVTWDITFMFWIIANCQSACVMIYQSIRIILLSVLMDAMIASAKCLMTICTLSSSDKFMCNFFLNQKWYIYNVLFFFYAWMRIFTFMYWIGCFKFSSFHWSQNWSKMLCSSIKIWLQFVVCFCFSYLLAWIIHLILVFSL